MNRRRFAKRLLGGIFDRTGSLLSRLPGPPLMSAGVIARSGGGRLALHRVDGMALLPGRTPRPFEDDQPFRVASVSKMVTASGFMSLVASGVVDLDADISRYLGARLRHPAFPDLPLNARMLLSHTSGLRNGVDFPVPFNRPLLNRLAEAAAAARHDEWFSDASEPPGGWFSYSDTNFAIVAQMIERIAGTRFDHFMRQTLFAPLRLDIGYNWSGVSQAKRRHAAAGCRWFDGAWTAQVDAAPPDAPDVALYRADGDSSSTEADYRLGENGFAFAPHGGLRLSLRDMNRLARFYAQGGGSIEALSAPAWRFTPEAANGATEHGFYRSFGLGVHTPIGHDGDAFFGVDTPHWRGHFGDAYGWMTGLFWNTHTGATLVYALNGMPETDRPRAARSALTAPEEALIDMALRALC